MDSSNPKFKKIISYIEKERIAVLSTANSAGEPHGAAVYLVVSANNLLLFITRVESLKYQNILKRPEITLTMVNAVEASTLQIDGAASTITDKEIIKRFVAELESITHPDKSLSVLTEDKFALVGVKIKQARLTAYVGNNMFDSNITEV